MKINKTMVSVAGTIAIMWAAWIYADKAEADVYYELGHTTFNSGVTYHGLGYRHKDWGIAVEATGQGWTKRGVQKVQPLVSFYKVTDPNWRVLWGNFHTVLGMAYTPHQKLVGPTNFRLEFFLEYPGGVELFIKHYSSAGLHKPNTGIDVVGMRKVF